MITKDNAIVGKEIFIGINDYPLDLPYYNKGIITDVLDDHYLYTDTTVDCHNVFGLYDTELTDSLVVFDTENEVKKWLHR